MLLKWKTAGLRRASSSLSTQWGLNKVVTKASCSTSPLPSSLVSPTFFSPILHSALSMVKLICSFWSKHFILFIFLLVPPPPPPPPPPPLLLRQGCAVRPFQSTGVVRSDGWLSTFCCLPLSSWEIYRHADYQAWKPISLSHSFLPSSIHACLAPSISLPQFQHHLSYKKRKKKLS